jgi:hypothetical protein
LNIISIIFNVKSLRSFIFAKFLGSCVTLPLLHISASTGYIPGDAALSESMGLGKHSWEVMGLA